MKLLRARPADERGAILIVATVGIVVGLISAALAIDLGTLATEARQNQKVADLAALDGVRALPDNPQSAVAIAAAANGFDSSVPGSSVVSETMIVLLGVTVPAPPAQANAVRVTVTSQSEHTILGGERTVSRKATATLGNGSGCTLPDLCVRVDGNPLGSVRVGSNLASVSTDDSELLNRFMSSVVGGSVTLTAGGWEGIADGHVSLGRLRNSLANQFLGQPAEATFRAGTVEQMLATGFTYTQLLSATAEALNQDGNSAVSTSLLALRDTTTLNGTLTLGQLLRASGSLGSGKDVAGGRISVLDIVRGGAVAADGDHFAAMNLSAGQIPGLPGVGATVKFGLIEAPQEAHGAPKDGSGTYRTVAHTGQVRLLVTTAIPMTIDPFGTVMLRVPYYFEAASADAKLDTMDCPVGATSPTSVKILGVTNAGSTSLGTVPDGNLDDGTNPTPTTATIASASAGVTVLGVPTTATLLVTTKNVLTNAIPGTSQLLEFTEYSDTTSQHIAASTVNIPHVAASDLNVQLTGVTIAGLDVSIASTINATLGGLKSGLVDPLFRNLGLSYAGADIWAPEPQLCHPTSYNVDPPPSTAVYIPTLIQ